MMFKKGDIQMGSSIEMNDIPGRWWETREEEDRFRNQNISAITTLNRVLKKNRQLALIKGYVTQKELEYGNFNNISEIFASLSDEYETAEDEFTTLNGKYKKASNDAECLPDVNNDIKSDIDGLKEGVFIAGNETDQILAAFPGLEELAEESVRLTTEHHTVAGDLEEKGGNLNDLEQKYDSAKKEKIRIEKDVSAKSRDLALLVETESSHRDKLADITKRAQIQQELTEEKQTLEKVTGTLKKSIEEKDKKIKDHETQTTRLNKEISGIKDESVKLREELKEYQALVVPFMSLKTEFENAEKELSEVDGQIAKLTTEADKMKKDEEMLRIKARQFEEIKKRMTGGIK